MDVSVVQTEKHVINVTPKVLKEPLKCPLVDVMMDTMKTPNNWIVKNVWLTSVRNVIILEFARNVETLICYLLIVRAKLKDSSQFL